MSDATKEVDKKVSRAIELIEKACQSYNEAKRLLKGDEEVAGPGEVPPPKIAGRGGGRSIVLFWEILVLIGVGLSAIAVLRI